MLVFAIAIDRAMAFTPWLLRSMMSPALEKRLEVDRVWPLHLISRSKKEHPRISVQLSAYICVKKVDGREEREKREKRQKGQKGLLTLIKADEKSKDQSG